MTVMRRRTPEELGRAARAALNKFSVSTRLAGAARDRAGIALVRNNLPATKGLFTDAQLAAVLREIDPTSRSCSWDALRRTAEAADEPMPTAPSPELVGLLGKPCRSCEVTFAAGDVAARERRLIASGYRRRPAQPAPTRSVLTSSARAAAHQGRTSTPSRDADRCPCRRCESRRGR